VNVRRTVFVAALTFFVACGGDGTGPIDFNYGTSGGISFTYSGAGGGIFSAKGVFTATALATVPYATTWATGWKDPSDNSTTIVANLSRPGGISDLAVIAIKGQTTGTVTIDPNCITTDTVTCNEVSFRVGHSSNGTSFAYVCSLTSGAITVLSISSTNATGTFSGAGSCFTSNGTSSAFAVTHGLFDVPLLASVPGNIV
jgi:hypothetical protein